MTNAARFTGWVPYTTSPEWLTRIRSLTRMWRKLLAERVDPEVVGELGVAHGDVAGDAFAEPEAPEDAQRAGQLLLAVEPLVLDRLEGRRPGELHDLRRQRHAVDRRDVGRARLRQRHAQQRYPSECLTPSECHGWGGPSPNTRMD